MAIASIAVLGGGYAGVLAARRLAAAQGGRAEVTLWSLTDRFVERIRLHQVAAGQPLVARPLGPLLGRARLEVGRIHAIDPIARVIETSAGPVRPDVVVNALGSVTARALPGAEHALALDDLATAAAVAATATADRPLAIVGGGLTAIELAAELAGARPGAAIALVTRGALGAGVLSAEGAAHARAALVARGVELCEWTAVDAIEPDALVCGGARRPVAATILCAGLVASPLAAAAGLAVDGVGRMLCAETLAVGDGWLWGAGDAAIPRAPVGAPLHMACKTAMPMAVRAADNVALVLRGREPRVFRFGDTGVCVSLGRRDAVIQRRDRTGAALGVITGRSGAWIKESVCRSTVRALRWPSLQRVFGLYHRRGVAALAEVSRAALPATTP